MNSIILTVFQNRCPLNSFNSIAYRIIKIMMPKIDKLNIVHLWILQVHSISCILETCSCLATTPTSPICCKARLVTKDLNFICLHIIYITIVVATNNIIAVINIKTSVVYLLEKEFLLAKCKPLLCLSCK